LMSSAEAIAGAKPMADQGIEVIRPGMLSMLQDLGRFGQQHLGIVPGGVMDPVAHRLANALVGNALNEATLEVTLLGPELLFRETSLIALSGARFDALLNGQALPLDRPVLVLAGARLKMRQASLGSRAYLAVAGGFAVAPVLGSRGTYLPAGFGGLKGRALVAGDRLVLHPDVAEISQQRFGRLVKRTALARGAEPASVAWSAPAMTLPSRQPIAIHALQGLHYNWFTEQARHDVFASTWQVLADSNRIGFRLTGPELKREKAGDIISGPTCLGTVQVPAGGLPIVLMADHQTTGGYAKILEVASLDSAALAQLAPGGRLQFVPCTLDEALQRRRQFNVNLLTKITAIQAKYG
jgi:antagonist of KipI